MADTAGETSDGYHTFNELYEHRHALFCALAATMPDLAWKSHKHEDGSQWDGWFVSGIELPNTKGITYHLPIRLWERFPGMELNEAPHWDGHTSDDVVTRLKTFAEEKE